MQDIYCAMSSNAADNAELSAANWQPVARPELRPVVLSEGEIDDSLLSELLEFVSDGRAA
jgi:hypothetical protein